MKVKILSYEEELVLNALLIKGSYSLREVQTMMILNALAKHEGNKTHAAYELGISVRSMRDKVKHLRMEKQAAYEKQKTKNIQTH